MNVNELVAEIRREDPSIIETALEIQSQIVERVEFFQGFIVVNPSGRQVIPFTRGPRVYFLMRGIHCVYIGQTIALPGRINQHVSDGKVFDNVGYIDVERREDLLIIEGLNILEHTPELNTTYDSMDQVIKMIANQMVFA